MSSSSLKPDGEPTVTATLAAEDYAYEVSPRHGSVHLMALGLEAREVLTKFDRNGDGEVDESELEGVIDVLVKEQFKGRLFLCGIMMVTFSLVLLLASSFGLTWAIVLLHKDTSVQGNVLMIKRTNEPVQLGNSDFTVNSAGRLVSTSASTLATAPHYVTRRLSSNMTTRVLNSLVRVSVNSTSGAQVGFKVTGFAIISTLTPAQLHISTHMGVLVLVGDRLSGSSPAMASLLDAHVVEGQSVTGLFFTT